MKSQSQNLQRNRVESTLKMFAALKVKWQHGHSTLIVLVIVAVILCLRRRGMGHAQSRSLAAQNVTRKVRENYFESGVRRFRNKIEDTARAHPRATATRILCTSNPTATPMNAEIATATIIPILVMRSRSSFLCSFITSVIFH
jgi:hypothetical protein